MDHSERPAKSISIFAAGLVYFPTILIVAVLMALAGPVNAQTCPPVGADTDCGIVITITDTSTSVNFNTSQPPYDTIEDTLVGVINNSGQDIYSLVLRSAKPIFAFDGDGICGTDPLTERPYNPVPNGCPFGSTGYEGPGVSFTNVSSSFMDGRVNFTPPLAAHGGKGYFSLEESITKPLYSCPEIVNKAVKPVASGADIDATFTPNLNLSLDDAAKYCGFVNFNWLQKTTHLVDPNAGYARNIGGAFNPAVTGPVKLTSSSTPFNDPPRGGGYTYTAAPDNSYPYYFDLHNGELLQHETGGLTLTFHDTPTNPCFPGGRGAGTPSCQNMTAPPGSYKGFTTRLAGVLPDNSPVDLGVGFNWTSDYNGTGGTT